MSGFLAPPAKIAQLERRLNSLEALLRKVITSDAQIRLDGTTLVGVLPPHTHLGTGEGGTVDGLIDNDADTYVKVEVTADSDVIESATAGTIRERLSVLGLQLANGADLLFYSDAFSTLKASIDAATGHIGIGTVPAAAGLIHSETINPVGAAWSSLTSNPTFDLAADHTQTLRSYGTALTVRSDGVARTQSGIVANLHAQGTIGGGGLELLTVADWRHFDAVFAINANNTVTDRYGVRIRDTTGSGTLTNQYGIYLENLDAAGTLNRAIQSLGGISTHLGAWSMGSNTAPGTGDILTLTAGHLSLLNNNELKLWDSGSSNFISIRSNAARTTDLIYVLPAADPVNATDVLTASVPVAGVVTLSWATPAGGGGGGHTIRENGTDQTSRTGLNFVDTDAGAGLITDDAGGNETEVNLNLYPLKSVLTTRGDLYRRSASTVERLATATDRKVVSFDGTDSSYQYSIVTGTYANRVTAFPNAAASVGALYLATDRNNTLYRCTASSTWIIVNPRRVRLEWYFDGKVGINNAARQGAIKWLPDDMGTWLPVRAWAQVATAPAEASGTIAGTADSGSTTTLVDSATSWTAKQFIGSVVTMTGGSQSGKSAIITDNTTTTLTFAAFAGAIAAGDTYTIASGIRIQFEYGASDTPGTDLFTQPASDATVDNRLHIAVTTVSNTRTTFTTASMAPDAAGDPTRVEMLVDGIGAAITGVHGIDLSVMLEVVATDG